MFDFFRKSPTNFILSKGVFHIHLDGPLDDESFQKKAKEQAYLLFAIGFSPNTKVWLPLRKNSWGFPDAPEEWVMSRYPNLSSICSGEALEGSDFYLQLAGSKFGPIPVASASQIDAANFNIYDLLLRGTNWKDWVLVENKEWLLKLIQKSVLSSKDTISKQDILNRELSAQNDSRKASRHSVIATIWHRGASGEKKLLGSCVDFSLTGTQVLLDKSYDLKVGDVLELSIRPSKIAANDKLDIYVELKGKLIWYNPQKMRLGFHFVELSPNTKAKLNLLVQHFV